MIWIALSSWTGLATNQAYDRGLTYNRNLDAAARQAALGWRPALAVGLGAAGGEVELVLTDAAGQAGHRCRDRGPLRAADQRGPGFRRDARGHRTRRLPRRLRAAAARAPGTCTRRSAVATTCSCTISGSCCPDHGQLARRDACAEPRAVGACPGRRCPSCGPSRSGGANVLHLLVEGVHCGACVRKIERTLEREGDLLTARVNLTTRRLTLRWQGDARRGNRLAQAVAGARLRRGAVRPGPAAGAGRPLRARAAALRGRRGLRRQQRDAARGLGVGRPLLRAWATPRATFLHWFEALIALPAIAYAGRPFFRSALRALRAGRTNMDVPISLAVILAPGMSLVETIRGGPHAYFDSAITLLFFLLIGRYLDQRARGSARSAAERLLALNAAAVSLLAARRDDPQRAPGAAGGRPGDPGRDRRAGRGGRHRRQRRRRARHGPDHRRDRAAARSARASASSPARSTSARPCGSESRAVGEGTLLAEIVRLMELAEQRRSRFVAIADRVARAYAPVVHSLALADLPGLDAERGGALADGPALCHRGADHHLPLRPGPGGAGGPGAGQQPADAPGHAAQVGDRAGAVRPGRHGRVRQDRDADGGPAGAAARPGRGGPSGGRRRWPAPRAIRWPGRWRQRRRRPRPRPASRRCRAAGSSWRRPSGEWRLGRRDWAAGVADDDAVGAELWLARPGARAGPLRLRRYAAPGCGGGGGRAAAARLRRGPAVRRSAADRRPCRGRARDHRLAGRLPAGRQGGPARGAGARRGARC